jgi:deoxyribodipyrimidine photo-lyase
MDKLDQSLSSARVRERRKGKYDPDGTCVVYWMQRAQRGVDNPALDLAVEAANLLGKPAVVFFAPVPFYPRANLRHYRFLLQGIPDIAEAVAYRNVGFVLRRYPDHSLLKFCDEVKPALVIGDENPLRETEHWRRIATRKLKIPFYTVDADVIVPSRLLEKAQYAPVHARRRLHARLQEFLVASPNPRAKVAWNAPRSMKSLSPNLDLTDGWQMDRSLDPVNAFKGGSKEAARLLREFVGEKLRRYAKERNHPELDSTSRMSPYLHFGHISPIKVALAVRQADAPREDKDSYIDELLTWRELAINFVTYNPVYDSFESGENWAHKSLAEHAKDPRKVLYTRRQMESAETHDHLWNAAQMQMVNSGWMHNYMRMYWAKKILEWSRTPADAYTTAVYLNDRYFLDGRDPNGYAGIAWSIVGKFDRPWFDRPIFGKIRYMSGASTGKKFDSARYIEQQTQARMF